MARDPAVVPLVLALVAVAALLASPVQNGDQPADRDPGGRGRAAGDARPGGVRRRCRRQLALRSLADPTPPAWSQFWFGSHPTTMQRIAIAQREVS